MTENQDWFGDFEIHAMRMGLEDGILSIGTGSKPKLSDEFMRLFRRVMQEPFEVSPPLLGGVKLIVDSWCRTRSPNEINMIFCITLDLLGEDPVYDKMLSSEIETTDIPQQIGKLSGNEVNECFRKIVRDAQTKEEMR